MKKIISLTAGLAVCTSLCAQTIRTDSIASNRTGADTLSSISRSRSAAGSSGTPSITNHANYILTYTYTTENDSLSVADIEYFDDLGYPMQRISIGASPQKNSIVTPIFYDALRRESRKYLPYAANDASGNYRPSALTSQAAFYDKLYGNDAGGYSYSESIYESSPLNRLTASYNVGNAYRMQDKKVTFNYGTNGEYEVLRFKVNSQALEKIGFQNARTLFAETVTDEDGTSTVTYKDFMGRVVCERVVGGGDDTPNDTYYVYDDRGNLCYVLPPELSVTAAAWGPGPVPDADLGDLAYVYKYDGRGRCIEKRLPGTDPVYMVYDKGDRLVMSQDGNMRDKNQWTYTEYDALNRPVTQRILCSSQPVSRLTLQNGFDNFAYPKKLQELGLSDAAMMSQTRYDAYVYREEKEMVSMDCIPIGTNIRGWTFQVTQTGSPDFPVDAVRSIFLNGKEWISIIHDSGDNVIIYCNIDIQATEENLWDLCDGGLYVDEGYTFTVKDDRDYIVTANDLPASNETIWGFDQIISVNPAFNH